MNLNLLNYFRKPNKGTKRKKSEKKQELAGDASALTGGVDATVADDEDKENNEPTVVEEITTDLQKYKHYFRELDIDVWLILTQPLTLSCRPEKVSLTLFIKFIGLYL